MEILTACRQINIDSLDLLNQEEATSLLGMDDPAKQDQVRAAFAARRESLTEPKQYDFSVAPLDFMHQMQAVDFARTSGLWNGVAVISPHAFGLLQLLFRITAWTGFEANGAPLTCTLDHKIMVFGQALHVIQTLAQKLAALETAEAKNSTTSAAG